MGTKRKPRVEYPGLTLATRTPCPVCNSLQCELWRILESRTFTEDERVSFLSIYHPEMEGAVPKR